MKERDYHARYERFTIRLSPKIKKHIDQELASYNKFRHSPRKRVSLNEWIDGALGFAAEFGYRFPEKKIQKLIANEPAVIVEMSKELKGLLRRAAKRPTPDLRERITAMTEELRSRRAGWAQDEDGLAPGDVVTAAPPREKLQEIAAAISGLSVGMPDPKIEVEEGEGW